MYSNLSNSIKNITYRNKKKIGKTLYFWCKKNLGAWYDTDNSQQGKVIPSGDRPLKCCLFTLPLIEITFIYLNVVFSSREGQKSKLCKGFESAVTITMYC